MNSNVRFKRDNVKPGEATGILKFLCNFTLLQQCSLEVKVFVAEPLLTPAQISGGNLLKVTLEAAYSVPESFIPIGPLQNYMVGMQVPSAGEVKTYSPIFIQIQTLVWLSLLLLLRFYSKQALLTAEFFRLKKKKNRLLLFYTQMLILQFTCYIQSVYNLYQ